MIHFVRGDLFESPAQTLVNTVNTEGVMGKGIALRFKKIYPDMFREYREICEQGRLAIGSLHVWRTPHKIVVNFPTKTTWRRPSRPEYIREGLMTFRAKYAELGIQSVAFPPLGCGNGELDFETTVRPIMEECLSGIRIPTYIYAPLPARTMPEHRTPGETENWLRGSPRDLPFEEVRRDLASMLAERTTIPSITGKAQLTAQFLTGADGEAVIRVWSGGRVASLRMELLSEVWNELRVRPMITASLTPGDREQDSRLIFAILARLPYVRVVATGEDYEAFRFTPTHALYLVPPHVHADEQVSLSLT